MTKKSTKKESLRVKFNLICNGESVRNLDELRENFCVDDIVSYYRSGLLSKWLDVRGFTDQLDRVNKIKSETLLDTVKALADALDVEVDDSSIKESINIMELMENRRNQYETIAKGMKKEQAIVEAYQSRYFSLIKDIFEYSDDITIIKSRIEEISSIYKWVFDLNYRELYWALKEKELYLPILCLLMNRNTRKYFLKSKDDVTSQDQENNPDISEEIGNIAHTRDTDKKDIFDNIRGLIARFLELPRDIVKEATCLGSESRCVEDPGKDFMFIKMEPEGYFSSNDGSEIKYSAIDNRFSFVILNGIKIIPPETAHGDSRRTIFYVEV